MKALFAALIFTSVIVQAQNEIIKIEISEPTTMCSRFACVKLAVGEAGIYNNDFIDGKKLAYGTLHEKSAIGSMSFPAGTLVKFQTPAREDFDAMDFSVIAKAAQTFSGVTFAAGTEVSFDRFRQVFLPVEKKLAQIEHDHGFVKVKGVPTEDVTIQDVTVTHVIYETNVYRLRTDQIKNLILFAGLVTQNSVYKAEAPVHLHEGSYIRIYKGQYAGMDVQNFKGFTIVPFGYKATNARFHLPSGRLTDANLIDYTDVQGYQVLGNVGFHTNGLVSIFEPAYNVVQKIEGVTINGLSTYYFEVQLHDTGHALLMPTTLVKENLDLLNPYIARGLPDDLDGDMGRLSFFFNPQGKLRALVLEPGFDQRPRGLEIYLVSGNLGSYEFEQIPMEQGIALKLRNSTRGYVQEEVEEYLKQH